MRTTSNPYRGFRYPAEIINQAVWLYHCFSLSLRAVELILAERGIVVSYETIRAWSLRFGRTYAETLRRRRPQPGDKWFLDEVFVRIRGKLHHLWRAVDQHGNVLDVLVQSRRNTKAATRFFRKLLKGLRYVPRVIVTDKLSSYGMAPIMPQLAHTSHEFRMILILTSGGQRREARTLKGSRGGIGYQRNRPLLYGSKDSSKKRY